MTVRKFSRRGFLELGTATGAAVLTASQRVHAAGSDVLKIGLVGCGNRGRGSLLDSLTAMPNVRVVALGDLFREKAVMTRAAIAASAIGKGRIDVPDERIFTGFDSYQGVIAESDIVHIALPSRFHPPYNLAAVQAGKHAFTEKPNGIDADGSSMPQWTAYSKAQPFGLYFGDDCRPLSEGPSELVKFMMRQQKDSHPIG